MDSRINRNAVGRAAPLLATLTAILLTAPFAAMRAQDPAAGTPPEIDATIRAANAQKNHEILERAAAAYEKVKQFDAAQKLLETALTIREETSGKGSGAYVAGLVKLGDLAIARRQYEEAIAFYEKAVSFGDRPEAAPALYHLAWREKDKTKTYDILQRVVNVANDKNLAGRALTYLADSVSVQPGRQSEAESMYQRALAMEDHSTDNALITMDHYARFLRSQNRNAEAEAIEKEKVASKLTVDTMPLPPDVYRVGNGVSAPRLLHKVEPEYTPEARAMQQEGTVLLGIVVDEDGNATNVTVVRSLGYELDEKAVEAVKKWKFKPGMKDGVPVAVKANIEVNFRLY